MITYFSNHQPIGRGRKNGAEDFKNLDRVLQDLGFAGKLHQDIFIQNEPETVFKGLETFQKSNGLKVDGALKDKDSETGIALNKALAEFYNPKERGGGQQAQVTKPTKPTMPGLPNDPSTGGAPTPGQIPLPTRIERQLRERGLDLEAIRRMTPQQQRRILEMSDAEFEKWFAGQPKD